MRELRERNKPLLFVLNVKLDLQKPVLMRRFLADPRTVFGAAELRGHFDRIRQLAGEFLGMADVRIVPIHAQAAYLSTRPEHREHARQLEEFSSLRVPLKALEDEVRNRGTVRRLQTILDGTVVSLIDLQADLREEAKAIRRAAAHLEAKSRELDALLDDFVRSTRTRVETAAAQLVAPLRAGVSAFVDDNIERKDVGGLWRRKVEALGIERWLERQQAAILDDLRARLLEFSREMQAETEFAATFDTTGPASFDPWDVRRTLRRIGTVAGVLGQKPRAKR
jgi:hypothetical protein